jgi:hypothetical protein
VTRGTSRSHTRLRASGQGDLLARRGAGGISQKRAAELLESLARFDDGETSIAEQIAAVVSLEPAITDEAVAIWCRGLARRTDAEAIVAQVRGNLAAGRPAGHGLPGEITRPLERVVEVVVDGEGSPTRLAATGDAQARLAERRRRRHADHDQARLLDHLRQHGSGPYGLNSLQADVWGLTGRVPAGHARAVLQRLCDAGDLEVDDDTEKPWLVQIRLAAEVS